MSFSVFDTDAQALRASLRKVIDMTPSVEIDEAIKDVSTEAYELGLKRGIERTHHQVRKVVFTLVFMLLGCIWLGYLASLTV